MSLGIVFKGPEGVVLAADSRVTLTAQIQAQGQNIHIPATYDNATKLLPFHKQPYVGAITYGLGAIGQAEPRTAHSFIPEFEAALNPQRLPVFDFARELSTFFMAKWNQNPFPNYAGPPMIFLVAGYDAGAAYGRVFQFGIPTDPNPVEQNAGTFGLLWGGQKEFADRIILGFDDSLPQHTQQELHLSDQQRDLLKTSLRTKYQAPIPYQFLPLQDCVDISIFLVRAGKRKNGRKHST